MKITTKITYLDNILLGILAGVAIAAGGLLNIICVSFGQKLLGSIAFSVGLITVCFFGLHLFTGKVGYLSENKKSFLFSLLLIYIGNVIGAVGFGLLMRLVGLADSQFASTINSISTKKLLDLGSGNGQSGLIIFALAFLCCNMVFLAVDIYKKNKNWFIKIFSIILCVAFFVYTGMEHCVADMFYLAVGNQFILHPLEAILSILISSVGNAIGAIVLHEIIIRSSVQEIV